MDNGGLRYGAIESALRPPLPTATPALAEIQIQAKLDQRLRAKHHRIDPRKQTPGGRHQIGTPAGFKSESVAGFLLECAAGFVGIRTLDDQRVADDAYMKCLHDNTGTFAIVSNEPAETVVKAAIGACFEARQALTDASQKAGAGLDDQWFAGLHQALSNQLIAYVLEMRAATALERAKNVPETKPDTDVKWK